MRLAIEVVSKITIEGISAMTNITIGLEHTEEEIILAFEASDDALEIAAGSEKVNFTLGACTGLSECPG
jgi:hypothetical protein